MTLWQMGLLSEWWAEGCRDIKADRRFGLWWGQRFAGHRPSVEPGWKVCPGPDDHVHDAAADDEDSVMIMSVFSG